ncbi:MAG TPA: glycosyltransferase [Bacteroidia bacterium]|jgi:glycosyltransferase involved in cell wall biosynthesis
MSVRSKGKERIAFLLLGVTSKHCGGAERFFSSFFSMYSEYGPARFRSFFICDRNTKETLIGIGRFKPGQEDVLLLKSYSNRLKHLLENLHLLFLILYKRIKAVHVCSYTPYYFEKLRFLGNLPAFLRPRIIVTIVSARPAYSLVDESDPHHHKDKETYGRLLEKVRVNAFLCWNKRFSEIANHLTFLHPDPLIYYIRSRYIESGAFVPAEKKQNLVVYSGRLVEPKRPLFFLEGVRILAQELNVPLGNWKFAIYGHGVLLPELQRRIKEGKLEQVVELKEETRMEKVLSVSRCYVSTQDYDNFPSLAINEAMACGNAVIARNLGQTSWFVKNGVNGLLLDEDSPHGLAQALKNYILHPEWHGAMSNASRNLVLQEHTRESFIQQVEEFWTKLFDRPA